MGDIVWLLRNDCPCNGDIGCAQELCNQAADEITRLRNDVALLKTMLPPGYKYEVFRIGKGLVND